MLLNCGVGEDYWESFGQQKDQTSPSWMKSVLNIHWKERCWSWSSNTLAIWYEELIHWKIPWCSERLKARGEGDNRRWDGWMTSLTWVWASSGGWCWTGEPGVLQSMESQWVGHDWMTELKWFLSLTESFPQFVMIHTVKGFSVVNETEVDVFLAFPRFLYDSVNVGNLISDLSAFSKARLDIWKFSVHIMLKPSM